MCDPMWLKYFNGLLRFSMFVGYNNLKITQKGKREAVKICFCGAEDPDSNNAPLYSLHYHSDLKIFNGFLTH